MADDKTATAIDVVARWAVARIAEHEIGTEWENYPEVGERDWLKIVDRVDQIITGISPTVDQAEAALGHLAGRAGGDRE